MQPVLDRLVALWRNEPALVISSLAAAVVFLAAKAGVVIDQQTLVDSLGIVLPILLGGTLIRRKVTPGTVVADPTAIPTDQKQEVPR